MVKPETHRILNDPKLLKAKEKAVERLSLFYHGGHDGKTCNLDGIVYFPPVDPYLEPERYVETVLDLLAENAHLIEDENYIRLLCVEYGYYGVHFVDKILGAEVYLLDNAWQSKYLTTPIGTLEMPNFETNPTVLLAKRLLKAYIDCDVKLPVFGLPTIASVLNIILNLYGQEVLIAMYTDPDAVKHDIKIIHEVLVKLHKIYLDALPLDQLQPVVAWQRTQPYGYGQLCGCSMQLLSKEMYDEFIAPYDEELLALYPNGGMIHFCGSHTQHLQTLRDMKSLHALQLNDRAAQDLQLYYDNLREDQVIYLNCCNVMPYEKAFEITKGKKIIFVEAGDPINIKE